MKAATNTWMREVVSYRTQTGPGTPLQDMISRLGHAHCPAAVDIPEQESWVHFVVLDVCTQAMNLCTALYSDPSQDHRGTCTFWICRLKCF